MKIRLFCAAGMSTSLLVTKMREAAKAMGIDADIEAAGETRMNEETEGVPVDVIPMVDYGTMNGKKVMEFAIKLAESKK